MVNEGGGIELSGQHDYMAIQIQMEMGIGYEANKQERRRKKNIHTRE